jgi:hypothetical protein
MRPPAAAGNTKGAMLQRKVSSTIPKETTMRITRHFRNAHTRHTQVLTAGATIIALPSVIALLGPASALAAGLAIVMVLI